MKLNIGIPDLKIKATTDLLNVVLSSEMSLYIKTRKAHWNVSGDSFMELHKLFEAQYKQLEESIDEIAERIGKLGHKTIGTMTEFSKLSLIKEHPAKYHSSKDTIKEIVADYETIIIHLRKNIEGTNSKNIDAVTTDFIIGLMSAHETAVWILRRYLN
ncbi:MAG: DNA starvation/stationary phase protection protein [Bacteroidota bacterium]